MRWAIEIQATQLDRRNLADLLRHLGFTLVEATPYVAFTSNDIDQCSSAHQVFETGKKVRDRFVGPAKIDPDFRIGSVIDFSVQPERRHSFLEVQSAMHFHTVIFPATLTVNPAPELSEEQLSEWRERQAEAEYRSKLDVQLSKLVPAYINPRAEKVLELLAIDAQTGETLYKLYELMRGPRSNAEAFGEEFGVSDNEYRRFADAVHLASVNGDWARHAHGDPPQTDNPMDKEEAEAFIRRLAAVWLERMCKAHLT